MLVSLHIENIAVVKCADIELGDGLTVLTGETGVGKSVIIDSIRLLMGARAQREQIRRGEDSATVAGLFSGLSRDAVESLSALGIEPDENGELYLQRTIYADGRGKTLVGGRQIPVSLQKEIGAALIAIHGQHDNQRLLRPEMHITFLDRFASSEKLIAEYKSAYDEYRKTKRELAEYDRDESEKARLIEMLGYQINDIDSAKLKPGEDDELERRRTKIRALEKLSRHVHTVYGTLCSGDGGPSARDQIGRALDSVRKLAEVIPDAESIIERLQSCMIEVDDIGETVYALQGDGDQDSTAVLDKIESRLETITRLKRKYGATVNDILRFRADAKSRLDAIEDSADVVAKLEKRLFAQKREAEQIAERLHAVREDAARRLSDAVTAELAFLEMGKARFAVGLRSVELGANGADEAEFVIATNPGDPLLPLHKIASGGELSRVMLALKCVLEDKDGTDTLIFDEVDTGVSGKTAQKLGIKLRMVAENSQVLCITHAAQIAALSASHLLVSKSEKEGRAETDIRTLDEDGRISELARIMGGEQITEKLLMGAKELRMLSIQEIDKIKRQ